MNSLLLFLLFTLIGVILFSYGGYLLPIWLFKPKQKESSPAPKSASGFTVVIPAFNEEDCIKEKIENTFAIKQPNINLQIIVISDGSTDKTFDYSTKYANVLCLYHQERRGKAAAMNRAVQHALYENIIFTDANTYLPEQTLLYCKEILENDASIGMITGNKQIIQSTDDSASGAGEGLYWKYENFLRNEDSKYYSAIGAVGEFMCVRKALYSDIPSNMVLDDFWLSMHICNQGYTLKFADKIAVTEYPSANTTEEWKRKTRIASGGIQIASYFLNKINFRKQFRLAYLYYSHRILRWTIVPFILPLVFGINTYLAFFSPGFEHIIGNGIVKSLWLGQALFYSWSFIGYLFRNKQFQISGFYAPYYFTFMNLAVWQGMYNYLFQNVSVKWERSKRKSLSV